MAKKPKPTPTKPKDEPIAQPLSGGLPPKPPKNP